MAGYQILALVGSLRAASFNHQLAETAVQVAPDGIQVRIYEALRRVPFYDEDLDVPCLADRAPARELRAAVAGSDGLLLFTPEYNGGAPAVLRNAIDWISRPYGTSAIQGKPVAIVSASISAHAGQWAYQDAVRAVGIAGGHVVEEAGLHFGRIAQRFAVQRPWEDAEVRNELTATVRHLATASYSLSADLRDRTV
ncbi:NAD(P)H-dependent oxidoreductase [Nocardia sp. NPDC052316]|uniref:NAD(P)H-dependent oxidoreductase n=1 Tax=Nocardia sp. NPDC052316 TaxID=3364329 RepID=UPI0037CC1609